jgi:branched-subunit amino acid aminotransferase/4-amino-4-deoxychorismate lyase
MADRDPRSEVFTTVAWDGAARLLAADLHFARLRRHAERLGISLPSDFEGLIFEALAGLDIPGVAIVGDDQAPHLIKVGISAGGQVSLTPRVNVTYPAELSAITLAAPIWDAGVRGTKHGDWQPYFEAREAARAHGADISLLVEDDCLVDGDRCMPMLLDADGVAYHPRPSEGALDSVTLEQIRTGIEAAGIPVRQARLTIPMVVRAAEMVVLGSGMGVQALATIDGRRIGKPRGRLHQAATASWLARLSSAWQSADDWK